MPEGVDIGVRIRANRGRGFGTGKGKPQHVPTEPYRHTVAVLRANGTPEITIARLLRMSVHTLSKHYGEELSEGKQTITAALGSVVVNAGLDGNIHAALSWLSRFGGEEWKRTENRLHGGLPGSVPIEVNARARIVILPDNSRPSLTEEEMAAERILARG